MFQFFVVLLLLLAGSVEAQPACLSDQNGQPVDWWMIFKGPRNYYASGEPWLSGNGYFYMDSTGYSAISSKYLNGTDSALTLTNQQLYASDADLDGLVMWNDEFPGLNRSSPEQFAHSKGSLAFKGTTGIWQQYSTPRFPAYLQDGYSYPHSGLDFGQNFACYSVGFGGIQAAVYSLYISRVRIFESHVSAFAGSKFYNLTAVVNGAYYQVPTVEHFSFTTLGGANITAVPKNAQWDSDLYEDGVAPVLDSDLEVESWTHDEGGNVLPTYCKAAGYQYNVYNIWDLNFGSSDASWDRNSDHSKFALATGVDTICSSDINRDYSQRKRGGMALCIHDVPTAHKTLYTAIKSIDGCNHSH